MIEVVLEALFRPYLTQHNNVLFQIQFRFSPSLQLISGSETSIHHDHLIKGRGGYTATSDDRQHLSKYKICTKQCLVAKRTPLI
jgi:hypothetical protein